MRYTLGQGNHSYYHLTHIKNKKYAAQFLSLNLSINSESQNYITLRKEYVLLNPEHVLPEFLLQYEYTHAEVEGITSQRSSIPSDKAPAVDLRENSCNIAYLQSRRDSSHGRGSDSSRYERFKPDSRNIGLPIKNSKFLNNDNKGFISESTEKRNISSCMKKGKESQNSPHTTKEEELRNMAKSDCSALFDKHVVIHRVRNARIDFITKRNESLKLDCVPFL